MSYRRLHLLAALGAIILGNAACAPPPAAPPAPPLPVAAVSATPVYARYVGVLPCADCQGIKTELTLFAGETYHLKETYLGTRHGDRVSEQRGTWTMRRGSDRDTDATVFQLNPRTGGEVRNFVKVDAGKIKLLDRNQREIVSNLNYTLVRTDTLVPRR